MATQNSASYLLEVYINKHNACFKNHDCISSFICNRELVSLSASSLLLVHRGMYLWLIFYKWSQRILCDIKGILHKKKFSINNHWVKSNWCSFLFLNGALGHLLNPSLTRNVQCPLSRTAANQQSRVPCHKVMRNSKFVLILASFQNHGTYFYHHNKVFPE